jgi:hypothetical protein
MSNIYAPIDVTCPFCCTVGRVVRDSWAGGGMAYAKAACACSTRRVRPADVTLAPVVSTADPLSF